MELFDLLGSDNLQLPYYNDSFGISKLLNVKFDCLLKELYQFSEVNTSDYMGYIKTIEATTNGIKDVIRKFLVGDVIGAGIDFFKIVSNIEPSIQEISDYYSKNAFYTYYRARLCDKKHPSFNEKKEFFHVPFELRHRVGNYRYSVSGFPCIYLGATPYTCYEELGRPKAEDLYFVKVEIPKKYNLITIGLLPYEFKAYLYKHGGTKNEKIIWHYLTMLPIIMGCSIKVNVDKRKEPFKEEYIIPQFVMQWLISSGRSFDGILYFSTKTRTYSRINNRLYQNLVLPVKEIGQNGYCKKLLRELKMTQPMSAYGMDFSKEYHANSFPVHEDAEYLPGNGRIRKEDGSEIHYSASGFKLIEEKLSQMECSAVKI